MTIQTTKVSEWMTKLVISVEPDTPIGEAHQIMKEKKIRRLPVVKHDKVVGIITIGDVREASPSDATSLSIWEINYLWGRLTVGKIMSKNVLTISPDTTVIEAAKMMLEKKISGLPVVDASHKLVGMITESDVFRMLVKSATA
ncbi:MAG: CBS domain-containing protein [Chloroflexi bacterium]|nr:CBS domain-containing protein [Chloroflexota bacterium]